MGEGPNQAGSSRRWIMQEVEASLRRLRTDWIDLYQVHRPEPFVDVDETLVRFPAWDEVGERAQRLVDVHEGLRAMDLVEVDPVSPQPAEARLDLYQVHRPEPFVDVDETLGALAHRPRPGREDPLPRFLDVPGRPDRRGPGDGGAARARASAAARRPNRSRPRRSAVHGSSTIRSAGNVEEPR